VPQPLWFWNGKVTIIETETLKKKGREKQRNFWSKTKNKTIKQNIS
jgi:hypothetical protein